MFEYRPKEYPTRPDVEGGATLAIVGTVLLVKGLDVIKALAIVAMGATWGGGVLYYPTEITSCNSKRHVMRNK